jgi:hypothetical protein
MAYPEFTSQSKGPDSSYDSTSWDSGSYLLSRVTGEFGTPPFVQGQEQIHGLSLSAVDPKSGVVVLSVTDGGRKHPLTLSGTAPSSVGASGQYPDGNSRYADPVSAVGVLFTYRHGASGLFGGKGTAARTVILSAGFGGTTISDRRHVLSSMELATPATDSMSRLDFETIAQPRSTIISTTISAGFSAAVLYSDHTTVNYNVTAYEKPWGAAGSTADPLSGGQIFAPYSTVDRDGGNYDSVGENLRRLRNSGYL